MTEKQQQAAAKQFAQEWKGRGYEKGESQPFWMALLRNVYGVQQPEQFISFENQVRLNNTSFIDGYIESTYVLIEQKGIDKDLRKAVKQSDGTLLNAFQQAKRYAAELPYSKRPRWVTPTPSVPTPTTPLTIWPRWRERRRFPASPTRRCTRRC